MMMFSQKVVTPVETGVQESCNYLKELDSGACPGPDPGSAGMTEKRKFRLFGRAPLIVDQRECADSHGRLSLRTK